jgi:hypothetical protein
MVSSCSSLCGYRLTRCSAVLPLLVRALASAPAQQSMRTMRNCTGRFSAATFWECAAHSIGVQLWQSTASVLSPSCSSAATTFSWPVRYGAHRGGVKVMVGGWRGFADTHREPEEEGVSVGECDQKQGEV